MYPERKRNFGFFEFRLLVNTRVGILRSQFIGTLGFGLGFPSGGISPNVAGSKIMTTCSNHFIFLRWLSIYMSRSAELAYVENQSGLGDPPYT